jgi:replicative DNA helicase
VQNQRVETVILKNLLKSDSYARKVLPFLKPEYFLDANDKVLYQTIAKFFDTYNSTPTYDALEVEVDGLSITEDVNKAVKATIEDIRNDHTTTSYDWLVDASEKFCKQKSAYNCILQSIDILNGKSQLKEESILDLMKDALAVNFDTNVGHDFMNQFDERFEYYHAVEEKIPFALDFFNRITKNGVSKGTLNVIIAGTGVGKSLSMCSFASDAMRSGKNVLYITLELAEMEVAKRIDANLMDTAIDDLLLLPDNIYKQKAAVMKSKTNGQLIVKQYPTAAASAAHFRSLINELNLKKNFKPDIVFIDYLNICASSRLKRGNANSYEYIKAIAEEIRGLAVEFAVPIFTATQTNRTGFVSTDIGLEDTSESFGLPATADFMFALISSEEMDALNQIMVKQLKNRYNDPTINKRFVVGVDRGKMKLYDVAITQQTLVDANQQPVQTQQPIKSVVVTSPGNNFKGFKVL